MSKLIHICAPNSSTGEERAAEEQRVQRMFPSAGVVCLLEGWRIEVHDAQSTPNANRVGTAEAFASIASKVQRAAEDSAASIVSRTTPIGQR